MPKISASDYLDAVDAALDEGATSIPAVRRYLTSRCTECGRSTRDMSEFELGQHSTAGPDGHFVVIGCEGYFIVNPNVLGFDMPDWQDWLLDLDPASDAARCTSCGHLPDECECPHDCTPAGEAE